MEHCSSTEYYRESIVLLDSGGLKVFSCKRQHTTVRMSWIIRCILMEPVPVDCKSISVPKLLSFRAGSRKINQSRFPTFPSCSFPTSNVIAPISIPDRLPMRMENFRLKGSLPETTEYSPGTTSKIMRGQIPTFFDVTKKKES